MSYYKIQNFEQYFKHYNKSVVNPKFWGKIAEENFTWYQLWDKVEFDMAEAIKVVYRSKMNIAKNIDRHLNKEVIKQP
jgi:acetyl-CoA synthetase